MSDLLLKQLITAFNLDDAVILQKSTISGDEQQLLFYASRSTAGIDMESINSFVLSTNADQLSLDGVVRVTSIPYTDAGVIDIDQLNQVSVFDAAAVTDLESAVKSEIGVEQAAVLLLPQSPQPDWLHVDELLSIPTHVTVDLAERENLPQTSAAYESKLEPSLLTAELPEYIAEMRHSLAERFVEVSDTEGAEFICLDSDLAAKHISYRQIRIQAGRVLTGLREQGVQPGDCVLIQLTEPEEIITTFWACQLGGFVSLILPELNDFSETSANLQKYSYIWRFMDGPVTVTDQFRAGRLSEILPERENIADAKLMTYATLSQLPESTDYYYADTDTPAIYVLTSGSTGMPKVIPQTHYRLITRAESTSLFCDNKPSDICLAWLPFDHIGTISDWHIRCVLLGNKVVHAKKEVLLSNVLLILDLVDRYRVTHTWAPNFAYALINTQIKSGYIAEWDLSCVITLLSAGEAVLPSVVREFHELLRPNQLALSAIKPAFGMAETGSGITYFVAESESVEDRIIVVDRHSLSHTVQLVDEDHPQATAFSCLGGPIPGISMRIVDHEQNIVPRGQVGRYQVTGCAVFDGYVKNPEVNAREFTADGWFNTGDLGFFHNGQLVISGREKEIIIINGANISAVEVEGVTEKVKGVVTSFACAGAVKDENNREQLAIFVSLDESYRPPAETLNQIKKEVTEKVGISPTYIIPLPTEKIPKTPIGKIQRTKLVKQFTAGEFAEITRAADLLLKNERTVPTWFYDTEFVLQMVRWQMPLRDNIRVAIKTHDETTASLVADSLKAGHIQVELAISSGELSQMMRDREPTAAPLDFIVFVLPPEKVVDLIDADKFNDQQARLLAAVQDIAGVTKSDMADGATILVVTRDIFAVDQANSPAVQYGLYPIIGMLSSLQQESPNQFLKHIDVASADVNDLGAIILSEMADCTKVKTIHYERGQRFVQHLKRVDLQSPVQDHLLATDGFYVVTGGLGGIGYELVQDLLARWPVKLLLLGRSSIDLKQSDDKATRLAVLARYADRLIYQAADITNEADLTAALSHAERAFGVRLKGVIHLAGQYAEKPIADLEWSDYQMVMAAKALGGVNLARALHARGGGRFVAFSSVSAYMGGSNMGAYAAANGFLEGLCVYLNQALPGIDAACYAWTAWRGVGMSSAVDMSAILAQLGYYSINVPLGLVSTYALLSRGVANAYIGLDVSKPNINLHLNQATGLSQAIAAVDKAAVNGNQPLTIMAQDRHGLSIDLPVKYLDALPTNEAGQIDYEAIRQGMLNRHVRVAPSTPVEKSLFSIWGDVLNHDDFGTADSFFDLGGNSLAAIQLFTHVEKRFGIDLEIATLFEAPTIAQLAVKISDMIPAENGNSLVVERPLAAANGQWTPLVQIQAGDGKNPLFCVHGGGGNVLNFQALATQLGELQTFYGLQAQGVDGKQRPLASIDEMAGLYLSHIKQVKRSGPYMLAGYSGGGLVAHRIAHMLREQGEEVSLLVYLDTYFPTLRPRNMKQTERLENIRRKGVGHFVTERVADRARKASAAVRRRLNTSLENIPLDMREQVIMDAFIQAGNSYEPAYFDGTVHLFRARELGRLKSHYPFDLGWSDHVADLRIYDFDGNHDNFILVPLSNAVGDKLRSLIQEASRG